MYKLSEEVTGERTGYEQIFHFQYRNMGDELGRKVEGLATQNTTEPSSFTADYDVVNNARVPGIITVNKPAFQGKEMNVPDKIVLNGGVDSETQGNLNIGLPNVSVNSDNYMGGMLTPPRTLTVDDTTSRFAERKVDEKDSRRKGFDRYYLLKFIFNGNS